MGLVLQTGGAQTTFCTQCSGTGNPLKGSNNGPCGGYLTGRVGEVNGPCGGINGPCGGDLRITLLSVSSQL